MPVPTMPMVKDNYDSRWFIWTIVFLVVTGISLVSYIALSDNTDAQYSGVTVAKSAAHKTVTTPVQATSTSATK
jgi:hypothetical protein